jgi:hypothetical protein
VPGKRGERPEPGQVIPGDWVTEQLGPFQDRCAAVMPGVLAQQFAEDRVGEAVGQAMPAQLGKLLAARSWGRQQVIHVSSVTTMPLNPAASARLTRLSARSRSVGMYNWKKPGVAPNPGGRFFHRIHVQGGGDHRHAGACRRPCRREVTVAIQGAQPDHAYRRHEQRRGQCQAGHRRVALTSIRGISPHRANAATFARCVLSSPAPPAT